MQDQHVIREVSKEKVYSNNGNSDVLNLIPANAKYILDIGCGDGSNARQLVQRNCIIDGITLSEKEKLIAEKTMRQVYVHNAENGLPFHGNELSDAVICSHVLEHICYPQQLIDDIHRVLKPTGVLIVALPNIMHYSARWSLMKGDFNYQDAGLWDYTHFRWYTFKTAQQLLQQHHFHIEVATVTGTLPFNRLFKKILPQRISNLFYSLLTGISKGFWGYQLLYKATKK
jgi:methionine biosynthesis protein MetW